MSESQLKNSKKTTNFLLIVGIIFIALNLRPALASVGPLIEEIRESTGLSNTLLGLLTTLPLIAFGVVSTLTPLFTKRFGIGGTLLGAMILLTIGIALRYFQWIPALYLGTFLLGIAIALGNVLLPSLTKRNFSENSGFITSMYSSLMSVGAALAAGLSVPLSDNLNLGWRGSLVVWGLLSCIAIFFWMPQVGKLKKNTNNRSFAVAMKKMVNSKLAWKIALFMGLQSMVFYTILAWLPVILQSRGYDAAFAGWMLSLSQATGIIGSLVIPYLAGKQKNQRGIVVVLVLLELVSLTGLLFPQFGLVALWVSILGIALGGTFGLALLFLVLRSHDTESATELSGMAQSIGYLVAATGPMLFGGIFDLTGNWDYAIMVLFVIAFIKLYMGLGAGKAEKV
ncbi:MFS transporter, CP family, cyanate transporter [Maribacter orientalis]|uniref:MFS transporter, CP family, cyanate transporter n=1 Tax=Maribacter orientalis TaxID=228957 RepID=A0A1H7LW97_9FLAO|nr:MFS transporter [Maribacter orientalis]SEL02597.1 MFS transporter, CP family, cyanate transporter [Maribacter orientalis]